MANYLSTTKTVTVKDWYGENWIQVKVEVTIDADGKVSYSATATNDGGGTAWRASSIILQIAGNTICDGKYSTSTTAFPNKHNTTKSNSNLCTTTSGSINITLKLCTKQDGNANDRWTDGTATVKSETLTRTIWKANTAGKKPSITDSGDNHFTITGYNGTAGTNNSITETVLQYKLGGGLLGGNWITASGNSLSSTAITASASSDSQTISARTRYKCQRGGDSSGYLYSDTATLDVKNYVAPKAPRNIYIDYTKNRFTIKENWTLKWTAGTKTNDSSPVVGYRIRIYRNGKTIQFKDLNGTILTTNGGSEDYYYDRDDTSTTMSINTTTNIFEPGDTVKVYIHTYTRNAKDSNKNLFSSGMDSPEYIVQNAGIMRVKSSGSWKEGQVWVKMGGAWKEADVVKVRAGGKWKESE